jgi:phosphatidylglycerophosphate synthase
MRRFGRTLVAIAVFRAGIGLAIVILFDPTVGTSIETCFVLLLVGFVSDQVDGWLARRYSTPNVAGYLQDAVSDKLLHVASLIALSRQFELIGIALWLVVARELTLLAIRIVSPSIEIALKRYRWQSLAYAACLRLGLVGFFLIAYSGQRLQTNFPATACYILLFGGVLFGLVSLAHMIRQLTKDGEP